MLTVTTFRFRSNALTPEGQRAFMANFARRGPVSGTLGLYVFADGSGGVTVVDSDDLAEFHTAALEMRQWIDFDTKLALPVEEASALLNAVLAQG